MTNTELKEQFERCEKWQDPEQWDLLGLAYYARGYELNALCCFRRAEACRRPISVAVETEIPA
jgi:hypothetical protein